MRQGVAAAHCEQALKDRFGIGNLSTGQRHKAEFSEQALFAMAEHCGAGAGGGARGRG
jgi:hypothetical protein